MKRCDPNGSQRFILLTLQTEYLFMFTDKS